MPNASDGQGHAALLARAPWADAAWLAEAPVVVRRDSGPAGWIPIGLRGRHRRERCAAWLPIDAVARRVTPEDIADSQAWRAPPTALRVPAVARLADIAVRLDAAAVRWGVGGSVGFALATGLAVLRPESDLDLIVRADDAASFASMVDVLRDLVRADVDGPTASPRVDIQIDTPAGGFALAERLRTGSTVLLKTSQGPRLVQDPWRVAP